MARVQSKDGTGRKGRSDRKAVSREKAHRSSARMAARAAAVSKGYYRVSGRRPIVWLSLLSMLLLGLSFPPVGWWPLAYVCLVPWLVGACATSRAPFVYGVSWAFGSASFLINVHWLYPVTPPGYIALGVYEGLLFPLMALPLRHFVRRRGWSVGLVFAVLWVAAEYARARTAIGFPCMYLAHTHYSVLPMIQISDLTGAHGVSFVIAMVNGWFADQLIRPTGLWSLLGKERRKRFSKMTAVVAVSISGTLGYGFYQLSRDTISEGPLVAVLQRDYPSLVSLEAQMRQPGPLEKAKAYFAMMEEVSSHGADLVVLPETPWPLYLDRDFLETEAFPEAELRTVQYWRMLQSWGRQWHEQNFSSYAKRNGCSIVVGGVGFELFPTNVYPNEMKYNSAYVYGPDGDYPKRYDKVHLMLFGEYVPFRYGRLHSLYRWLNSITPWGADGTEYSLTAGNDFHTFSMEAASQDGKSYDFGTPICYEDVVPYVARKFARGEDGKKQIDFLVNISNDGWFNHGPELFQHLTICAFRAVENRVGVARSVNTGISGFIDPNGRICDTVPGATVGYRVARVMVDERESLYTRWGDWFAIGCSLLGVAGLVDAVVVRRFVHLRKSTPEGTP